MSARSRSPHGRSVQSARSTSLDMAAVGAVARLEADRSSVAPSPQNRGMAEIRALRRSTAIAIPRATFRSLVRELTQERVGDDDFRWTQTAINAVQTASEDYLVGIFEDSTVASAHARRVTCMLQDIRLVRRLRLHNEVQGENPRHGW
mmetsp:Transcript_54677/g.124475  ORF Transcript_54677/g.124475 Transcript_54677/m.124475 type:complete len:148 (-) Transcript_54677:342-785(-)|eukprot:CAMPEP_0204329584 /NCGR_PEP_ID=MMETSP0469-20131031/14266_1 /ASSEMBLY_ACC=CAM_ASM_000384 /TAXON_ID=2969 /ORGANISM="Oxyrrhis marina" /LENGTH=147 /DNA_ID=CAMNT_0051312217 /DNA_START=26 /DNA_END=469 /DNA_ORIENTATION=-